MKKVIEVVVSPQGETRVETRGFAGGECRQASRSLEAALGLREAEQLTPEFYRLAENTQQQGVSGAQPSD